MSGCCCKGRAEGRHDLLCEQVLTAAHLASGHMTTSEDVAEGEEMSDETSRAMEENSRQDRRRAEAAQAASTELVGIELIVAYNHTKTDPSQMASYGHSVAKGYEFALEQDGTTFTVTVTRDSH